MRNDFERDIARQLKKKRKKFEYESERLPYILERTYTPDFVVCLKGRTVYIEGKGFLRMEDKNKLRAVRRCHPGIDLRILFDSDRNLKRNQKWCEKNNIPCAAINIPEEWLK